MIRSKIFLPFALLFVLSFAMLLLIVKVGLDRSSLEARKGALDSFVLHNIKPFPREALTADASSVVMNEYFSQIRNSDATIFGIRVVDISQHVIYSNPVDNPVGSFDITPYRLNIENAFVVGVPNVWLSISDGHGVAMPLESFVRGIVPLRDIGGETHYVAIIDATLGYAYQQNSVMLYLFAFLVGLMLLLVFAVEYVLISRTLVKPIIGLMKVASSIARGDLGAMSDLNSKDEIGRLAQSVNAMAANTRDLFRGFDRKVADKTHTLAAQLVEIKESRNIMASLLEDSQVLQEKERRQAEDIQQALLETAKVAHQADKERSTYSLLLASIKEGVIMLNPEQKITIVNNSAIQLLGSSDKELMGATLSDSCFFLHDNKTPITREYWENLFISEKDIPALNDVWLVARQRTIPVYFEVSRIIHTQNGEVEGVILMIRDVSEERSLEDARVGFISTASHQLRTPLTSMRWFSEMLIAGDAGAITDEQRHFIERIYQGVDRMIALVNLLLQLARVEAGRVKIEPVPIDIKATTEAVVLMLKQSLDAKKQQVVVISKPEQISVILMDQDVIWQVIQNLLTNANRYAFDGSTINVTITEDDKMTTYCVADSGIGIPDKQKDQIFEKFFRAENATAKVPEGSGLGLVLVKALTEKWGGRIWFESKENVGTKFCFTVPKSGMRPEDGEVKLRV
ncbi:MAG: Alkaline phosphatase synthesis sensor protein PhoR [Parcubacteria group bacterium GW2011_GWA2_47_7]|nr:MAG: Alkaline phosphatase synthesis sensor protein PhoR [Parcubacteria group bacterium GW2011_GWA2_47_7]